MNNYLKIVLAACIWGSAGLFIKKISIPTESLLVLRFLGPLLVIIPFFFFSRNNPFKGYDVKVLLGGFLTGMRMFFYIFLFEPPQGPIQFLHSTLSQSS